MEKVSPRTALWGGVFFALLSILAFCTARVKAPTAHSGSSSSTPISITPYASPPVPPITITPNREPTSTPNSATPGETMKFPTSISLPTPVPIYDPPVVSTLPKPPQATPFPQPEGTINILLLGSDRRPDEKVARTDTIILVAIEPQVPSVNVVSIPRDLYVWIPTQGHERINTAYTYGVLHHYPGGGMGLMKAAFLYNFGIQVHYGALIDFESFRAMVDAVGGVDVLVDAPLYDTFPDESEPSGWASLRLDPGIHHMDGKLALQYVRSRKTTSDFDRNRRQQQVLRALYEQVMGPKLYKNLPAAWEAAQQYLETDLDFNTVMYLAGVATRLDQRHIKNRMVEAYDVVYPWTTFNNDSVLLPYPERFKDFLTEALTPPLTTRLERAAPRVRIFDNSGVFNCGILLRDQFVLRGFDVVWVFADPSIIRTEIIDYTTTSKGSALPKLQNILGAWLERVVSNPQDESTREVEFDVHLGPGFGLCRQQ